MILLSNFQQMLHLKFQQNSFPLQPWSQISSSLHSLQPYAAREHDSFIQQWQRLETKNTPKNCKARKRLLLFNVLPKSQFGIKAPPSVKQLASRKDTNPAPQGVEVRIKEVEAVFKRFFFVGGGAILKNNGLKVVLCGFFPPK